jgi:hypothetical protein
VRGTHHEACVEEHRADGDSDCGTARTEAGNSASDRRRCDAEHDQGVAERTPPQRAEGDADDGKRSDRVREDREQPCGHEVEVIRRRGCRAQPNGP